MSMWETSVLKFYHTDNVNQLPKVHTHELYTLQEVSMETSCNDEWYVGSGLSRTQLRHNLWPASIGGYSDEEGRLPFSSAQSKHISNLLRCLGLTSYER